MGETNLPSWGCSALTTIMGALSVEAVSKTILLILGIISGVFSLAYNIYCWYKESKKDGKISSDEIKQGADILKKGIEDIQKKVDKEDK